MTYNVFSVVYFNKADLSLCEVNNKANLPTVEKKIICAEDKIKCIILQYAKKKGKLDNPNTWFCSQMQCKDP